MNLPQSMLQFSENKYWISPTSLYFSLNSRGLPNYLQVSVQSGAVVMAHMEDVAGLDYDSGHNFRRWELSAAPTVFNTYSEKYVYVAIPRPTSGKTTAQIVFPSEYIDIYGKNEAEEQIGSEDYYYLFTNGIITSSGVNGKENRDWATDHRVVFGKLHTDQAINNPTENDWFKYSTFDQIVTFVKDIVMEADTKFRKLYASIITIVSGGEISFEDGGKVKKVATFGNLTDDSAENIVTPAYLSEREAEVEKKYLRKDQSDSTDYDFSASKTTENSYALQSDQFGNVIVNKLWAQFLAVFHADARSLNFIESLVTGKGWRIDKDGNMELESLKVRSALEVLELIKNKISAQQGDFVFTESITADRVEYDVDLETYTLIARETDEKYCLKENDILRGVLSADDGTSRTSWVKVILQGMTEDRYFAEVVVLDDSEVPAKKNYAPVKDMVFHRWGNASDPDRQSCWYISSPEKRIVMLDHVSKPILEESNYAAFLGLPYGLSTFKGHSLKQDQPYLYVRGAFLQDLHIIDYKGQVVKTERFRGTWSAETAASADPYAVTETTFDTVYHNNAKYQCLVNGTKAVPSATSSGWLLLQEAMKGDKGADGTIVIGEAARHFLSRESFIAFSQKVIGETYLIDEDEEDNNVSAIMTWDGEYPEYWDWAKINNAYINKEDGHLYISQHDKPWKDAGRYVGEDGKDGKDGVSITGVTNFYKASNTRPDIPSVDKIYTIDCVNGTYDANGKPTQDEDGNGTGRFKGIQFQVSSNGSFMRYTSATYNGIINKGSGVRTLTIKDLPVGREVYVEGFNLANDITNLSGGKIVEARDEHVTIQTTYHTLVISVARYVKFETSAIISSISWNLYGTQREALEKEGWTDSVPTTDEKVWYVVLTERDDNTFDLTGISEYPKGKDGKQAPPLRGPLNWNAETTYYSGAEGEPYQDIVFNPEYDAQMFLCKVTNTNVKPSADTSAASAWDAAHPWYMTQFQEFVASKVFFAQKAIIENLALNSANAYERNEDGTLNIEKPTITIDGATGKLTAHDAEIGGILKAQALFLDYAQYKEYGYAERYDETDFREYVSLQHINVARLQPDTPSFINVYRKYLDRAKLEDDWVDKYIVLPHPAKCVGKVIEIYSPNSKKDRMYYIQQIGITSEKDAEGNITDDAMPAIENQDGTFHTMWGREYLSCILSAKKYEIDDESSMCKLKVVSAFINGYYRWVVLECLNGKLQEKNHFG